MIEKTEMATTFRFALKVGEFSCGVVSVSEIKKSIIADEFFVFPITIKAGVYRGKDKNALLMTAFAMPARNEKINSNKKKRFEVEIQSFLETAEGNENIANWTLHRCKFISYKLGPFDAGMNDILLEEVVIRPEDFSVAYSDHEYVKPNPIVPKQTLVE